MLRADGVAEVVGTHRSGIHVLIRDADIRTHVEQLAELGGYLHVEVEEKLPAALEERTQVVGVVHEERRLAVGRHDGVPMEVAPLAVVGDAYVAHGTLGAVVAFDGHGERLHAVSRGYQAAVAVGLLCEVVATLHYRMSVAVELLHPLHGWEVGGGEQAGSRTLLPFGSGVGSGLLSIC